MFSKLAKAHNQTLKNHTDYLINGIKKSDIFDNDYYRLEEERLTKQELIEKYGSLKNIPSPQISCAVPIKDISVLPSIIVEAIWRIADEPIYVVRAFLAYDNGEHLDLCGYHLKKKDIHSYVIPFLKLNPQIKTLDISCNYLDKTTISKILQTSNLKHINAQNNMVTEKLYYNSNTPSETEGGQTASSLFTQVFSTKNHSSFKQKEKNRHPKKRKISFNFT